MKAYRIGRVQLPWTNLVPPIHGGVHRRLTDDNDDTEVDLESIAPSNSDSAEVSSLFSAQREPVSSDEDEPEQVATTEVEKTDREGDASQVRLRIKSHPTGPTNPDASPLPMEKLSPEAYTAAMEQKEIADSVRKYPSLDQDTQDAIRAEYRALHKLVQENGLYECHYSEYGKEAIRYAIIFSCFLFFLRIEWYIPSACFLGFFWVCFMNLVSYLIRAHQEDAN